VSRALFGRRTLTELGVGIVAFVAYWRILALDKILLLHNTDFRHFLMGELRARDASQYLPGASGDFTRSLGISEYPTSLLFDLPWLFATHVPTEYLQIAFGLVTWMSLYLAVIFLGERCSVDPTVRRSAAFLLPFLMAFPSNISWNRFSLYASSYSWMAATVTLALLAIERTRRSSLGVSILTGTLAGAFVFLGNIHYLPMTLPSVVIGLCLILSFTKDVRQRRRTIQSSAAMSVSLILVVPVFLGIYLFGVWAISDVAVSDNVDLLTWAQLPSFMLPFPHINQLPLLSTVLPGQTIQLAMVVVLVVSGLFAHRQGKKALAKLGLFALAIFFVHAGLYGLVAIALRRELGIDPHYSEIIAYPLWILLLMNLTFSVLPRKLRHDYVIGVVVPVVLILGWTSQWVVRNWDQRQAPPEYPIRVSSTTPKLKELVRIDNSQGLIARTIIVQAQFPWDRGGAEGYRIRRMDNFAETLLLELNDTRIPVLNAYTHMMSPRTFSLTNRLFGDGRPAWRQASTYDVANVEAMPLLGIRYVLSEVPLDDSRLSLVSAEPYLMYGLFPAPDLAYLYRVDIEHDDAPISAYSFIGDRLIVQGFSSETTSVVIPVEFSRCLRVTPRPMTSSVTLGKDDMGLITMEFVGKLHVELDYQNSIFQLRNCRIRDYFDFRKEQTR
jgi:hypothetical protein